LRLAGKEKFHLPVNGLLFENKFACHHGGSSASFSKESNSNGPIVEGHERVLKNKI
jgi:hypothetical protein